MTTITFTYDGGPRCLAHHTESGDTINTDAPVDNGGTGSSFSPTDLVAAGLGTCMAVYLGKAAEKHDWNMRGTRLEVRKEMVADPLRRIGRLIVDIYLNRSFDDKEMKILTNAVTTCPVKLSISDSIQVPVTFHLPKNSELH
ncbi:MAG: OsmC family protein [Ignavibacteria bacterium]|nr:OsmC family protein [Ignavibacteria bacterium]